jgi:Zn-finger nucleic acid-binding protein
MKCPTCPDTDLVMSDRQGIEIDYCPKCRGVWLDRGELDKIIERSIAATPTAAPASVAPSQSFPPPRRDRDWDDDDDDRYEVKYDKHGRPYKKSKAKSFFGEIFDF